MKNLKLQELSKKELVAIDGGYYDDGKGGCLIPLPIIIMPYPGTEPNF